MKGVVVRPDTDPDELRGKKFDYVFFDGRPTPLDPEFEEWIQKQREEIAKSAALTDTQLGIFLADVEYSSEPKSKWSGAVWMGVIGLSLLIHWLIWIHRL